MANEWKASDFESYWGFYNTARGWQTEMQTALSKATDYFYRHNYDQLSTSQEDINSINDTTNLIRVRSQEFASEYMESGLYDSAADEAEEFEASLEIDGHIMGKEEDWTPEMAEFVRKTREHRQQLAEARAKATTDHKKKEDIDWVEKDLDDFILAEEIGVHGVNKPTTSAPTHNQEEVKRKAQMEKLYGSKCEKVAHLETQINNRFEQIYKNTNPKLWPNIPMRF